MYRAVGCVTVRRVRVQDNVSCLWVACENGHLDVVKYLYKCGGKELLMLTKNVGHLFFGREDACLSL